MYVYIKSEPKLWTVGFYDPQGKWQPESDWAKTDDAAARVAYLNGGNKTSPVNADLLAACEDGLHQFSKLLDWAELQIESTWDEEREAIHTLQTAIEAAESED